jgi:hypothetical protein
MPENPTVDEFVAVAFLRVQPDDPLSGRIRESRE